MQSFELTLSVRLMEAVDAGLAAGWAVVWLQDPRASLSLSDEFSK